MQVIDAKAAAGMSREEALRVLASGLGVPDQSKRLARMMLEAMRSGDQTPPTPPRRKLLAVAVKAAVVQLGVEAKEALDQGYIDLRGAWELQRGR